MEKVWVEISRENLQNNIVQFRERVGREIKICSTLKANAYGHGMIELAPIVESLVDFIAVDSINEAQALKSSGVAKPILILGYTRLENMQQLLNNGFHQVVADFEILKRLGELAFKNQKVAKVHLKVETGTNRQGLFINDLNKFIVHIKNNQNINLSGLSTHYANIEDTTDHTYAFRQLELFKNAAIIVEKSGFSDVIKHTACSAAAVLYPETYFDMIRLGIGQYGLWSSPETFVSAKQKNVQINLKPVLSWKTIVAQIKTLPAGSYISYGCTEKVEEPTKIAILPVGYYDGFDRKLSSIGNVLIRGKRCKILGRVCMNMCVVDVNHLSDIKLEDEVVLLGSQGEETISAEEVARKIGTINYEVVTRINPLIKRVII